MVIKYTTDEDVAIVQAYMAITIGSRVGIQDGALNIRWSRIFDIFVLFCGDGDNPNGRSKRSIQCRFKMIKNVVDMLLIFVVDMQVRNPHLSSADRFLFAKEEYHEETGSRFKFDECYEIFKNNLGGYDP